MRVGSEVDAGFARDLLVGVLRPVPLGHGADLVVGQIARDEAVASPSLTRAYPLVAESGSGMVVTDVDGNRFLDFAAGIAV